LIFDPLRVDDSEFWAAGFAGELLVGEGGCVGLLLDALLEVLKIFEVEDLAAAHEVDDLAGGAIDGVHADEVGVFVDADGVEAVVVDWLHGVEGVVGIAERPALVVGKDDGDVVELGEGDVRARFVCWGSQEKEGEGQEYGKRHQKSSLLTLFLPVTAYQRQRPPRRRQAMPEAPDR
jgi:hypothetical protein